MVPDLSGLTLIFAGGALALLSPCGFPMLPGYISYYMGARVSLEKAVYSGIACFLGILTVLSAIGVLVSTLGSFLSSYIPLLEVFAGVISIFMGVSMIVQMKFLSFALSPKAPKRRGVVGIFLYGIAYGLAILGCSAQLFLSTIFYAVSVGGIPYGILTFIVYAMGMALPIMITTFLVARAKKFLLERIVKMTPWFQKVSGVVLILVGAYLIYVYAITFSTV